MKLDTLDSVCRALCVLGNIDCYIESGAPYNPDHESLYVMFMHEPFVRLYDNDDTITRYRLRNPSNVDAQKRFDYLLDLNIHKRRYPAFMGYGIVTDFFLNWNPGQRKDFIECASKDSLIELTCIRFYAKGKPKFKTLCKILDVKINKIKEDI